MRRTLLLAALFLLATHPAGAMGTVEMRQAGASLAPLGGLFIAGGIVMSAVYVEGLDAGGKPGLLAGGAACLIGGGAMLAGGISLLVSADFQEDRQRPRRRAWVVPYGTPGGAGAVLVGRF